MNNDNINKKSDSFNFADVVKKINSDAEGTPWYKKKVSIISMSSALGVGALATVIAVPIALTSSSSTIVLPPTTNPAEALANFNNLQLKDKIIMYNTIMADTTNNNAIKDYFIKNTGMSKFFIENIQPITSGVDKAIYDAFKTFLPTYKGTAVSNNGTNYNVEYTPVDESNFLKIKAVGKIADGKTINYDDSSNSTNLYCSHGIFSGIIGRYNFYSPMVDTITNVTMNNDFSITMSLSTDTNIQNMAFRLINSSTTTPHYISYKTTIKFSDTTLFPKMSEFVKKSILNLTV